VTSVGLSRLTALFKIMPPMPYTEQWIGGEISYYVFVDRVYTDDNRMGHANPDDRVLKEGEYWIDFVQLCQGSVYDEG
jgi:hypothetical protein